LLFSPGKFFNAGDLHADGLDDLVGSFGCNLNEALGRGNAGCAAVPLSMINTSNVNLGWMLGYDDVIPFSSGSQSVEIAGSFPAKPMLSRNQGAGERGIALPPITPDMLKSVSDAYGELANFNYYPLTSKAGRTSTELQLYRVPNRDSGQGYVDSNHFYFQSSMNVVSEMQRRNGIGSMNTVRYGYEEAMYNNKGRGFTGFRKIVTEDVANGLRSATVFHQKYPLISQVECSLTQALSDL
jgi:Insecticide toxin TcdB middle/N-terminal region